MGKLGRPSADSFHAWHAALAAASFLTHMTAFAQNSGTASPAPGTAGQDQGTEMQEIVVTAQKRSERLIDVPISISVLDSNQLESSGITNFTDIDQISIGTKIDQVGIYYEPNIRGINSHVVGLGQENNVAVYVDGFYQPSQVSLNFDFANIQDVEVLKGPQGTLFGRNATGGAILINTLDPSFTPVLKASASYGRFNEAIEQAYFSDKVTDNVAFDASVYLKNSDGWIRDIGGWDTNPSEEREFRTKWLFVPSDPLRITATLGYTYLSDATGLAYTYPNRSLALAVDPTTIVATAPNQTSLNSGPQNWIQNAVGTVKVEYDFGGPRLTSYSGYTRENGFIAFDLDGSTLPLFYEQLWTHLGSASQEFDLTGKNHDLDWVTGTFFSSSSYAYTNTQALATPTTFGPATDERMWTTAAAAFADATYHLEDGLSITGGLRYSWEEHKYFWSTGGVTLVDYTSANWHAWTPRGVLRYELTPSQNVYASFSKGFKSGTFNTGGPDSTPVNPESIKAYEVGHKYQNPWLQFSDAVFYYDYRNLQVTRLTFTIDGTENNELANAARAKIYGAEFQTVLNLSREWTVNGGVAYTHARYTSYPNASVFPPTDEGGIALNSTTAEVQDWSGLRIAGAPDWTASLGLTWSHPLGGGSVGASGNVYFSSAYAPSVDDQLNGTYRYEQGSYARLNLNTFYAPDRNWKFTLWCRNLTNRLVKIVDEGSPFGDDVVYAEPRTCGGRVNYSL